MNVACAVLDWSQHHLECAKQDKWLTLLLCLKAISQSNSQVRGHFLGEQAL
jgi:hypothetical protein